MSHGFKSRYEEMLDGKPEGQQMVSNETGADENQYSEPGNVRNICFVWPDGKMKFLNYAYMVSGEYYPNDSKIVLEFTSEKVTIFGTDLNFLFIQLLNHTPKNIKWHDFRYAALKTENYCIERIEIT